MTSDFSATSPGLPSPRSARVEAMTAVLAQNWWAIALRGVLAIVFGVMAFILPTATILSLVLVFSVYMLIDGVIGIISAIRAAGRHERWGFLVLEGVANIALGIAVFLWPGLTVIVFVLLVAAWAIVTGILMIAAAFRLDGAHGRWWLLLSGVVSAIFGVLLVLGPVIGAVVLTWWFGAYALIFGATLLVLAFRLRQRQTASSVATRA